MKNILILILFFLSYTSKAQPWIADYSPTNFSWKYCGNPGFTADTAIQTRLAISQTGVPYLVFRDYAYGHEISVMKFDGNAWTYVGSPGFSVNLLSNPSIVLTSSDMPLVAFNQYDNMEEIFIKKYNGNYWETIGDIGVSHIDNLSLAISQSDVPYIAYRLYTYPAYGGFVVNSPNSSGGWPYVGYPYKVGTGIYISLAVSPSNVPFVAYMDLDFNGKASVKKFNGTDWEYVGQSGFSTGVAYYSCLAFNPGGDPFVGFKDYSTNNKVTVMKFDGNNWLPVGLPGFSAGAVNDVSLAISSTGEPFVAYRDSIFGNRTTVMKFNGSEWIYVGPPGFSAGSASTPSIALSSANQPFITYQDFAYSKKATVLKFDSVFVGLNDQTGSYINLFPNPTNDRVTLEFENNNRNVKNIAIYNNLGVKLSEFKTCNNFVNIDLLDFAPGMYFVKLSSEQNNKFEKFFKL